MSNILIVDDDPDIRKLVSHILEKAGYFVMSAESALDAMNKELEVVPDLLILDKMMPGMDGFELVEKLKSEQATSFIRVIMLTSCDSTRDFVEGLDAGADDYVAKPVDPDLLLSRVRSQLRTKALIDRLVYENKSLRNKIEENDKE
jgi:DNA-binding response OmpR family regulator